MPYVFDFDHRHPKPPMEMKDLLGGKGANLAEMTSVLGLPVPPGFTISTATCRDYMESGWPDALTGEVRRAQASRGSHGKAHRRSERPPARLGALGRQVLDAGDDGHGPQPRPQRPIGRGAGHPDRRRALRLDSYRRFIAMYGRIVLDIPGQEFDDLFEAAKELAGTTWDAEVPTELLRYLVHSYPGQIVERHTGRPFPQDPEAQLHGAIEAVFRSWNGPRAVAYRERERIAHDLGTAVNVQAMVFGNRDDRSGTGVGFTRDPATGATGAYGDFLVNAQGEGVMALGIRNTDPLSTLADTFPEVHAELMDIFDRLERHYRDMCDTEFTIEQGKLWMLQTRVGKRTGRATLRMAVEMTQDPPDPVEPGGGGVPHHRGPPGGRAAPPNGRKGYTVLTKGLGASPGAAVGRVYLTAEGAVEAEGKARGETVLLVRRGPRRTTCRECWPPRASSPLGAAGKSHGGRGPGLGEAGRRRSRVAPDLRAPADRGGRHHRRGRLAVDRWHLGLGRPGPGAPQPGGPSVEFYRLLEWADEIRTGRLGVHANADTGPDALQARQLGAGIGLCRTEHMFLGEDRLPVVRRMILADTPEQEEKALEELREVQRADFVDILAAMDGLPVTVRLLDPPAPRVPARYR